MIHFQFPALYPLPHLLRPKALLGGSGVWLYTPEEKVSAIQSVSSTLMYFNVVPSRLQEGLLVQAGSDRAVNALKERKNLCVTQWRQTRMYTY